MSQFRFSLLPLLALVALIGLAMGGGWSWLGIAVLSCTFVLGDFIVAEPHHSHSDANATMSNALLIIATLLGAVMFIYCLTLFRAQATGSWSLGVVWSAPIPTTFSNLGAALTLGAFMGTIVGNAGHEYMHRVNRRGYFTVSQLLFGACQYGTCVVDHVYLHHRHVGTFDDATTARRQESFWRFLLRCQWQVQCHALAFEIDRLSEEPIIKRVVKNRVYHGYVFQLAYLAIVWVVAGPLGLGYYLISALTGIILIDLFNYIGHFGLVRAPKRRICHRHSWNSKRRVSSGISFNITHHAEHHIAGTKPYWELEVDPAYPMHPFGPGLMILISLVPPLWFSMMTPVLEDWDRRFASLEELQILKESKPQGV